VEKNKKMIDIDGSIYEGDWKNSKRSGLGKLIYKYGAIYEGNWKNNKISGVGKMVYMNGDIYEGNWKNSKRSGLGKMIWKHGSIYDGDWKNNKRSGLGKMVYNDYGIYEGNWKNSKRSGLGKMVYNDGAIYEGDWKNNKISGVGKMVYNDGGIYEGDWKNNKKSGLGKLIYGIYEGTFKNDKRNGVGKMIYTDGSIIYEGIWKNGDITIKYMSETEYETCAKGSKDKDGNDQIISGILFEPLMRKQAVHPPEGGFQCYDREELQRWLKQAKYEETNPVTGTTIKGPWINNTYPFGLNYEYPNKATFHRENVRIQMGLINQLRSLDVRVGRLADDAPEREGVERQRQRVISAYDEITADIHAYRRTLNDEQPEGGPNHGGKTKRKSTKKRKGKSAKKTKKRK